MLFRLAQDMPGDQLAVVFDKSKASFRDAIYADYKANRLKPPWTPAAPTSTRSAAWGGSSPVSCPLRSRGSG
jgi:hypothetical protein